MSRWSLLDRKASTDTDQDVEPILIDPALVVLDEALVAFAGRTLVAGDEVVDRLLDLRSALAAATLLRELEEQPAAR
jgi:hypothetical protein